MLSLRMFHAAPSSSSLSSIRDSFISRRSVRVNSLASVPYDSDIATTQDLLRRESVLSQACVVVCYL